MKKLKILAIIVALMIGAPLLAPGHGGGGFHGGGGGGFHGGGRAFHGGGFHHEGYGRGGFGGRGLYGGWGGWGWDVAPGAVIAGDIYDAESPVEEETDFQVGTEEPIESQDTFYDRSDDDQRTREEFL